MRHFINSDSHFPERNDIVKKTKKIVEVVDDFDGTPADQTVRFAFNGASYEIDLNRAHFEEFAEAIQPYAAAMRATPLSASRTRRFAHGRRKMGTMCPSVDVFPLRLLRNTARLRPDISHTNCGYAVCVPTICIHAVRGGAHQAHRPSPVENVSPWRRRYSHPSRWRPAGRLRPCTGPRCWSP